MIDYRTAAAGKESAIELRSVGGAVATAIVVAFAIVSIVMITICSGPTIHCERAGGAVACHARDPSELWAATPFEGTKGELRSFDREEEPTVKLTAGRWTSAPLDKWSAARAITKYEAFIADPQARELDVRVLGSWIVTLAFLLGAGAVFFGLRKSKVGHRVAIDQARGTVKLTTLLAFGRRGDSKTYALPELANVRAQPTEDGEAHEILAVLAGKPVILVRTDRLAGERMARFIAAAIPDR